MHGKKLESLQITTFSYCSKFLQDHPMVTAAMDDNTSHVALLPSPGMGHIIPLFQFAKRLVIQHGFHVTFLNITTESSAAQNQLLRSPGLPPRFHVVDLPSVDLSHLVFEDTPLFTSLCLNVRESLRNLKTILMELPTKPKALIIDLFGTHAFEIGHELSIPIFSFSPSSNHFLALSLHLPKLDKEVEGAFVDLPEPVQIPGCTPIRTEDMVDQLRDRKSDDYKWALYHLSRVTISSGILLNSWEELETISIKAIGEHPYYRQISTPPVYPIGPCIKHSDPLTEVGVPCLAWLDKQPSHSVLYVALGSGGTLSREQLFEMAWGLELSQQRFIWVVRTPNDANASATFFQAGGDANDPKSYLPDGFVERTKEFGLLVPSWAPQIAILGHASTGAFLSHCGWNSSLESVAHGVPLITWPLYAEQRMNATTLTEDIGVAAKPVADPGKSVIGREEIARVVKMVMEGEEGKAIRRKAKVLKETARKALDAGGSSYASLSLATKQWKSELQM